MRGKYFVDVFLVALFAHLLILPGTLFSQADFFQEASRKTYKDPEFFREYRKLVGEEPTPLLPENHEKAIKEIPRDPEVIGLYKKLVGAEPLPPR